MASSSGSGGMKLGSVLGVIFVVLKLVGVITWKWIWVLSPFWIGFAIWIFLAIILGVLVALFNK